jgi:hypothetical protein
LPLIEANIQDGEIPAGPMAIQWMPRLPIIIERKQGMAIAREELKSMDFRDVATGRRLAPVHPGDVLMKDFIEAMGITRYKVAKLAGVQQRRIDEICAGKRLITGDTALPGCSAPTPLSGSTCNDGTILKPPIETCTSASRQK